MKFGQGFRSHTCIQHIDHMLTKSVLWLHRRMRKTRTWIEVLRLCSTPTYQYRSHSSVYNMSSDVICGHVFRLHMMALVFPRDPCCVQRHDIYLEIYFLHFHIGIWSVSTSNTTFTSILYQTVGLYLKQKITSEVQWKMLNHKVTRSPWLFISLVQEPSQL